MIKDVVLQQNQNRDDDGLGDIRIETQRLQVITILALAYAGIVASLVAVPSASPPPPWDPLPLVFGLTATAGTVFWLLRFGPLASGLAMVTGLIATLSALVILHPGSLFAGYFFLIVLAATGAYDWRLGLVAAIACGAVLIDLTQLDTGVVSAQVEHQSLVWIGTTFVLSWLPTRPLRSTIHWAWSSYQLALDKAEEARARQGELARVSKSLAEACERLERLNHELQEAKEAADSARRHKAEFAAMVGHELRTPINLVLGFTQMMASPRRGNFYAEPLPECYRSDIQTIIHNAEHISSLVDDILDLSQIDAHRMALRKEVLDLPAVANEAVASVLPLYTDAGLYLTVDVPGDLPRILADPVRVRQILINLLFNAVRFTHRGGVVITAYTTDADAVISVQDTGVGIPQASLSRVFDEFRQVSEPLRHRNGTGLGLAVCKRFVELHGGNIWAESEVDYGTTISFSLPLQANIASASVHRLPALVNVPERGFGDVGVLDETGETVKVIERYLDDYRLHAINRPEQAIRLAQNGELRAMIVTCTSTEAHWHDYQRAHPELRGVPTFVCPLRTHQSVARSLQTAAYLTKPINRQQIAQTLRRLRHPFHRFAVIEDNAEMRSLLVRMLRSLARQAQIFEAADGEAGLRLIREVRPDVVVLDLMMPGADGEALLGEMQTDTALREIPVVIVSAHGPNEEVLVGMVGVSRHDGLTVGEAMGYLKVDLDTSLRRPSRPASADTVSAPLEGSPA